VPSRGAILTTECHLRTDELAVLLGEHLAAAIPGRCAGLLAAPSCSGEGRAMCLWWQRQLGLCELPMWEGDADVKGVRRIVHPIHLFLKLGELYYSEPNKSLATITSTLLRTKLENCSSPFTQKDPSTAIRCAAFYNLYL
jgi:hypothetical protein